MPSVDNNKIKQVDKQELLDVFIDENLMWTAHIEYLCATISTKVSLLKQLSSYVPLEIQKLFYQGYMLPLIDYGPNTWRTKSYTQDCRADKYPYPHDRRAGKDSYPHDRNMTD